MSGSKADRPYGSFDRPAPPSVVIPKPPRRRWDRLPTWRSRAGSELALAGAVGALAAAVIASVLSPSAPAVTTQQLDRAIAKALGSATPKPNVAVAAYAAVRKSVVQVRVRTAADAPFFTRASGVILDQGGSVLTSLHSLGEADEIRVVFFDGSESPALVTNAQPENDIALLEVLAPPGLVPATLASPKVLRMGDEAIVVGSPFGLGDSLSAGVISGFARMYQPSWQSAPLRDLIQFDAAVNTGSFGGPLVNRKGEVVGIVIAYASPSSASAFSGVGFAIPIDSAANAAGSAPF